MVRAILVDDEELSLTFLKKKLEGFKEFRIIKTYQDKEDVLAAVRNETFDAAFLDIEMAAFSGLELAEEILKIQPAIHIVFVSAYAEYAVKAFEMESVDYLLKPVVTERLKKTVSRITQSKKYWSRYEDILAADTIAVQSFGEFSVSHNGNPVQFKTSKAKELFAFLIAHKEEPVHRDLIIEQLWPEHDYKRAKIYLHTCISHLRKMLAALNHADCIQYAGQCYALTLAALHYDGDQLERCKYILEHPEAGTIHLLEYAASLYSGRFLEMNGYDWSFEKANRYDLLAAQVFQQLAGHYIKTDSDKALYWLEILKKYDPYSDETAQQMMKLLLEKGRRHEAIQLFKTHARILKTELGLEPSGELAKLYGTLILA